MEITIPYYSDNTRFSNSNIGMYLKYGPKYLKGILDGTQEGLSAKFLDTGTMIHMYILEKDNFWKNYEILDFETPTSKQQVLFAEEYIKSTEIDPDQNLTKSYKIAYSVKGKSEEKILSEATELYEKIKDYIEYLKIGKTGKTIISWNQLNTLKAIEQNIKDHKKANMLVYEKPETTEEYNEFHINWELKYSKSSGEEATILCKSLLDKFRIDHDLKVISLIDLKTTSHIFDFEESMKEFDYHRQMAFYWSAIHWYFKYVLNINIADYTYETYIIAISNRSDATVRVFKLNPIIIESRLDIIIPTLQKMQWHKETNQWDHSREYYEGDGSETLNMVV